MIKTPVLVLLIRPSLKLLRVPIIIVLTRMQSPSQKIFKFENLSILIC